MRDDMGGGAELPEKAEGVYRVIHTADWHLGKCLGERTRDAEHDAFLLFLQQAMREHRVDALVIAGDIFDSANPPQRAVRQYYDFLSGLYCDGECAVVVTAGNHDSPAHLDAPRDLLRSLRTYVVGACPAEAAQMLLVLPSPDNPQLVVAAIPFLRDRDLRTAQVGLGADAIRKALVAGVERVYLSLADAAEVWQARGVPLMATGHLTVTGAQSSDSERDIHVGGLGEVGSRIFPECFSYVALGHFHRPQRIRGHEHIRYAGSPLPLSFSEANDHKALRVLDFGEGRLLGQYALPVPTHRHLLRLQVQRLTLEEDLAAVLPPPAKLPAWAEVCVEGATGGENLHDLVQQAVANRDDLEVLQVTRPRHKLPTGFLFDLAEDPAEDVDAVLGNPREIFARRLEAEDELSDAQREALTTAFNELLDMHAEAQRESCEEVLA